MAIDLFAPWNDAEEAAQRRAAQVAEKSRLREVSRAVVANGTADFAIRVDRRDLAEMREEGNTRLVIALARQIAIMRAAVLRP